MKKLLFVVLPFFMACGATETSENNGNEVADVEPTYEYIMGSKWSLTPDNSTVTWNRVLDQKATKKKVKLFGNWVDMEMGPVKLNMSGDVQLNQGHITERDGEPYNGAIEFDLTKLKFAQEKGEGIFNTKEYPYSTVEFLSFEKMETDTYNANIKLTIQNHAEIINDVSVGIIENDSIMSLNTEFTFNTMDFPLRDNTQKSEINKDEITADMELYFTVGETFVADSVQSK